MLAMTCAMIELAMGHSLCYNAVDESAGQLTAHIELQTYINPFGAPIER